MIEKIIQKKMAKYIKIISDLLMLPNGEVKNKKLLEALTKYSKFCYKHQLNAFYGLKDYASELDSLFIIDSKPEMEKVNEQEVWDVVEKLQEVLKENKVSGKLVKGITFDEAELLLKWDVTKAREIVGRKYGDINTLSLSGACGFMQILTLRPFQKLGVDVTLNNARFFPKANNRALHAFGTVNLPIMQGEIVSMKRYLLDASYRQFFTVKNCNEGLFYIDQAPYAGYFMERSVKEKKFAQELLEKGYVLATPEVMKMYGYGFSATSTLTLDNLEMIRELQEIPAEEYFETVLNSQMNYDNVGVLGTLEANGLLNFPVREEILKKEAS